MQSNAKQPTIDKDAPMVVPPRSVNDMLEFLTASSSAPLWAAAGAIAVKALDFILARRKIDGEGVSAHLGHIHASQDQLVTGLFKQIEELRSEMEILRGDLKDTRIDQKNTHDELQRTRDDLVETRLELEQTRLQLQARENDLTSAHERITALQAQLDTAFNI